MKRSVLLTLGLSIVVAVWWLFFDGGAPASGEGEFDLAAYRTLVAGDSELPSEVRVEILATDSVPKLFAEVKGGVRSFQLAYPSFQILAPDSTIVVGAAVDEESAAEIASSDEATFDAAAYRRLSTALETADQVWVSHEHFDHMMAIVRHPNPAALVDRLRLVAPQLAVLPEAAGEHSLAPELAHVEPFALQVPTRIAPGVVVAPAAGHSLGSQVFYVKTATGRELLLVGDIVWARSNVENLRTRPRILQYAYFKMREDRPRVLRQVRALHDMAQAHPELTLIPDHDGDHLRSLVDRGVLKAGFVAR